MKILEVIPLSRGINKDVLSYFTSQDVAPGTIVTVPLRGRTVNALVVASRTAEESRIELKNAAFAFKKIAGVVTNDLLSAPFLAAAKKAADYHVASLGSLLFSIVPKNVLEHAGDLVHLSAPARTPEPLHGAILQGDDEERFSNYRSLVREEFAKGRSVFLCMPTTGDIKRAEKLLEKGIAEYSYIFHGQMKKKELLSQWNTLALEPHPVFIIGTGQFFCVPRHDIGTIIIEREHSRSYKSQSRPFTDLRYVAEMFAKETNARIIFSDMLLRTETMWRYRNDELRDIIPPSLRIPTNADSRVIDMRKTRTGPSASAFDPFSNTIADLIAHSRERNERLVLFSNRRGLSPITVCTDCGNAVTCQNCQAPIVLHSRGGKSGGVNGAAGARDDVRYFLCHRCGERRDANEKCKICASWRLNTVGIGIELVAEEITKRFPDQNVFRIDSDTIKTNAQARMITQKFYDSPGGILLGTEMALLYLDQKVENVAVISMDSMFGVPDFRIRERNLSTLIRLRSLAQKSFYIQTRNSTEPIFAFAAKGNLLDFYKQEIEEREQFDYPPLTTLVKISLSGEKQAVAEAMQQLATDFTDFNIETYPAFSPLARGEYTMHALIKIGRTRWFNHIEPALYEKLRALPPSFSIAVDPESLL